VNGPSTPIPLQQLRSTLEARLAALEKALADPARHASLEQLILELARAATEEADAAARQGLAEVERQAQSLANSVRSEGRAALEAERASSASLREKLQQAERDPGRGHERESWPDDGPRRACWQHQQRREPAADTAARMDEQQDGHRVDRELQQRLRFRAGPSRADHVDAEHREREVGDGGAEELAGVVRADAAGGRVEEGVVTAGEPQRPERAQRSALRTAVISVLISDGVTRRRAGLPCAARFQSSRWPPTNRFAALTAPPSPASLLATRRAAISRSRVVLAASTSLTTTFGSSPARVASRMTKVRST